LVLRNHDTAARCVPQKERPMRKFLFLFLAMLFATPLATACTLEDDTIDDSVEAAESSESSESGEAADVEPADEFRTVYGPFTNLTIYPPPDTVIAGGLCPWFWDICDVTCPSCNALTADHGHTCVSCPQGESDCNCATGGAGGVWTDPRSGITYQNKWFPKIHY
jgi:hypothetical protein